MYMYKITSSEQLHRIHGTHKLQITKYDAATDPKKASGIRGKSDTAS